MRHRHLTLMHGGRCGCERCVFETRATVAFVLLGLAAAGIAWLVVA